MLSRARGCLPHALPCGNPKLTRREIDAVRGENQATNRRENLLKFAASRLLLTLWVNRVRRNRSAASTAAPATTTRTSTAAGPATAARSAATALPAPTASCSTSARRTARIAAARATPAARGRRAGRDATCRRVHAVRIRFAKGINRGKNHQGDHRREQRVLGRILSRFLSPDSFEECLHHGVFVRRNPPSGYQQTAFILL